VGRPPPPTLGAGCTAEFEPRNSQTCLLLLLRDPRLAEVLPSAVRRVVREAHVTAYHLLWELVHVFPDAPEAAA
jgi:hypothetical protein